MSSTIRTYVVGTPTRTRYFAKAEFTRVTENNKAVFKIGKVYYYFNTSLLKYSNSNTPLFEELIPGELVEIEMMFETSISSHQIIKMFLIDYKQIPQNHKLNVGVIYAKNEGEFLFKVLSTNETSNPNLFLVDLENEETGDVISCRVWEDVSHLKNKTIQCVLDLRSTQNLIRFSETTKAYECYIQWEDKEYLDKNENQVIKKDVKKFVPVLELARSVYVQAKDDVKDVVEETTII